MIMAFQLFGRDAYSPKEKKILKTARLTARDLFQKRYKEDMKDRFGVPADQVTLHMVESAVVESVIKQHNLGHHTR